MSDTPRTRIIADNIRLAINADNTEQSYAHREEAIREIEQLERELAAMTKERDTLFQETMSDKWYLKSQQLQSTLEAVQSTHYALSQARSTAESERDALRAHVAELEKGEYICRKCGLRKDGEGEKGNF